MALTTTLENRILQIEGKAVLCKPNNNNPSNLLCVLDGSFHPAKIALGDWAASNGSFDTTWAEVPRG
jgi:hypothetical protein